jgi:hypothetical protein
MNINRNNYEQFFLLYVDNELSVTDKLLVDAFINENADLAIELQMLQDAVLHFDMEECLLEDKTFLLKHSNASITTTNAEEQFLLYIDNELTEKSKKEVETFVLQHPQQQVLFTQLKQTILPTETIICPNKNRLLKQESNRRIVYMRFARIAVAAIFIGVLAITSFIWLNNDKNNSATNIASTTLTINNKNAKNNTVITIESKKENKESSNKTAFAKNNLNKIKNNSTYFKTTVTKTNASSYNNSKVTTEDNIVENKTNIIVIPAIKDLEALVSIEKNKITPTEKTISYNGNNTIIEAGNKQTENENIVHQTVYKELDTNADNKGLYIASLELNKEKLRGILRKASKLFTNKEKAANENSNQTAASYTISNK